MRKLFSKMSDHFLRLPSAGLDISDRTVKAFKFRRGVKPAIEYFTQIEVPEGIIAEGEIKNEKEFARVLSTGLRREKNFSTRDWCAVSLPEEKSFVRIIQLPKVKRAQVGQAIRWEIEGNIPLPAETLVYDHEIVEPIEDHLDHFDIVITAFPREIVAAYVRSLSLAGIRPFALELESQSIVRAAIPNLRSPDATLVMDIGRHRTSFILFSGGAIVFTSTIKLGGLMLEQNIAKTLGVDAREAERVKKEIGLSKVLLGGKVFSALAPALSVVADELRRAVRYYQDSPRARHLHGASPSIARIILVGGDASLYGLDTYLSSALKIPALVGDPFAGVPGGLSETIPAIPKNQALAFSTAIGLALRGLEQTEKHA